MEESGEKELRKAFEDVTTRNVQAAISFSNETRNVVRNLEKKIEQLEEQNRIFQKEVQNLRMLLANLQTEVFRGGS